MLVATFIRIWCKQLLFSTHMASEVKSFLLTLSFLAPSMQALHRFMSQGFSEKILQASDHGFCLRDSVRCYLNNGQGTPITTCLSLVLGQSHSCHNWPTCRPYAPYAVQTFFTMLKSLEALTPHPGSLLCHVSTFPHTASAAFALSS